MSPALAKLKWKLFSRYTPAQLHIDLGTEEIIEPQKPSIGGLRYRLVMKNHAQPMQISIEHRKEDQFNIFISWLYEKMHPADIVTAKTRAAFEARFISIDLEIKRVIDVVASDE